MGAPLDPGTDATDVGSRVADADARRATLIRGSGGQRTLVGLRRRPGEDHPVRRLLSLLGGLLGVGTLLLMLPIAAVDGSVTSPVTALFTATSAITGTGFAVVDTGTYWSTFGQLVILLLVILGGFGIMATTGLVLVVLGRRADLRSRMLLRSSTGMPLADTRGILLRTMAFVSVVTVVGAVVLGVLFAVRGSSLADAAWTGLFQSASAFNNAGFSLVGGSSGMTALADDLGIVCATAILMLIGSLGLVAALEVWSYRQGRRISVESRLVLVGSGALVVAGALFILLAEGSNPATLGPMGPLERVANALFASISARSTGLNTVDIGAMRPETQAMTVLLMFIGGAVGSTAGGIRVNTFAVLVVVIIATLRRRAEPAALGRRLEPRTVYLAVTVTGLGVALVLAATLIMQLLVDDPDPAARSSLGFLVVSALGNVGLATGPTDHLDDVAQIALVVCMLIGRVSVLVLAILFTRGIRTRGGRPPRGIMRVA